MMGRSWVLRDTGPGEKQKLGADTEGESTDELDTGSRKGTEGREERLLSDHSLWLLTGAWTPSGQGLMGRQLRPCGGSRSLPAEGSINLPPGHQDNTETGLLRFYPPKAPNTLSPRTRRSLSPSTQIKEDKGLSFPETSEILWSRSGLCGSECAHQPWAQLGTWHEARGYFLRA